MISFTFEKSIFLELCLYEEFRVFIRRLLVLPATLDLEWTRRSLGSGLIYDAVKKKREIVQFVHYNKEAVHAAIEQFIEENRFYIGVVRAIEVMVPNYIIAAHSDPKNVKRKPLKYTGDLHKIVLKSLQYLMIRPTSFDDFITYYNKALRPLARLPEFRNLDITGEVSNVSDDEKANELVRKLLVKSESIITNNIQPLDKGLASMLRFMLNNTVTTDILYNFFDRVVIINLDRRKDRWDAVQKKLAEIKWPFKEPIRFSAYDGNEMPQPVGWTSGAGTWGCLLSHREVIGQAIKDKVNSLLVLEDDIFFVEDFEARVAQFIQEVPTDWEQVMLGGQFFMDQSKVYDISPNVLQVSLCHRAHAYGVRGAFMKYTYAKFNSTYGHVDHIMNTYQEHYKVYAPRTFLIGQDGSASDIAGTRSTPDLIRDAPEPGTPVYLIKDDAALCKEILEMQPQLPLYYMSPQHAGNSKELVKIFNFYTDKDIENDMRLRRNCVAAVNKCLISGIWYARSVYPSKYLVVMAVPARYLSIFDEAGYYGINLVKIDTLQQLQEHVATRDKYKAAESLTTLFDETKKIQSDEPDKIAKEDIKADTEDTKSRSK